MMRSGDLPTISLIPLEPIIAAELAEGNMRLIEFARNLNDAAPLVQDTARGILALYARTGQQSPWIGYLALDPASWEIAGSCAFKDAPRDGSVEIAYFTFPAFEGRGWGTAMAGRLVETAFADGTVATVIAHTRPEENASTEVLRRNGFSLAGPVEDPEDGLVWRWQRGRTAAAA